MAKQHSLAQSPPARTDNGLKDLLWHSLGPLALGLSLGLQWMMTAFMFFGRASSVQFRDQLTDYGRTVTFPEHELAFYVVGVAITLGLIVVIDRWWQGRRESFPAERQAAFTWSGVITATASLALYLSQLSSRLAFTPAGTREPEGAWDGWALLVPGAMAIAWVLLDSRRAGGSSDPNAGNANDRPTVLNRVLTWGMPVFIILVIGVPKELWTDMAGQFYETDEFLHLNFFMMGPALAFKHGMAFGTEIYSQYGIGWPLLLASLHASSHLTYGSIAGLEVVYGCIYYVALFFLLRKCFRNELWAALGTGLAFYLQIFSGFSPQEKQIWLFPSSTMMRHPMDVWFFAALWGHRQSGKILWLALAGICSGLAILFETETGGYLLVTFFLYWLLSAGLAPTEDRSAVKRGRFIPLVVFYGLAMATLLPLMFYASRGTLFTSAFWAGWMEAVVKYGSWGVAALPMVTLDNDAVTLFLVMLAVYMGVIGWTGLRCLKRRAGRDEVFLAVVAAYGLALLLLFVNRSHHNNLYHPAVPFAVVLTALLYRYVRVNAGRMRVSAFPSVLAGGLFLLLLTKADFLIYPSLLSSFFKSAPSAGLSLLSDPQDISGLPLNAEGFVREFNTVRSAIQTIGPKDGSLAILDASDTLLYVATDVRPWSRYTTLFHMALTKQSVGDIQADLIGRPPQYVVIRGQKWRPAKWIFIWTPLYEEITNRYELHQTVPPFEIWQRPGSVH